MEKQINQSKKRDENDALFFNSSIVAILWVQLLKSWIQLLQS